MPAWALWAVALAFFLAALHPFTTYPASLVLIRRWKRAPAVGAGRPDNGLSFAICFCAYNEERVIRQKIENLLAVKRIVPNLELLAYVDGATDRTAEILSEHAEEIATHVSRERHGKTYGMNTLVAAAKASIVVFTDANVMLDLDALDNLRRYFADPQVGCVCGHLIYVNSGKSPTASTGSLFWRLEEWIKQRETETGSAMGADGSLFAIRRALHRPPPAHLIDDMYVSLSILCDGYRVVRGPDVLAYEEAVTASREDFQRKIRIACQAFNVHRALWPRLRRLSALPLYEYLSHKLLRWLSVYNLVLAAVLCEAAFVASGAERLGLVLAIAGALVLVAGGSLRVKPFKELCEILLALLATGIGVWRSCKGEQFRIWTPASSIRS